MLNKKESEFNDIRSFRDFEVESTLSSLVQSQMELRKIRRFMFKGRNYLYGIFIGFTFRRWLKSMAKEIKNTYDFQSKITIPAVGNIIKKSTDGVSCSGVEKLKNNVGYFFISNHRDIVLDTALLNYFLLRNNIETAHSAFGDNLIVNSFTERLMRINKGFIVKRNLSLREQFISSKHLSKYINYLLTNNESVWIAQSDGRSKDGRDITKPSVLKMLTFSQRKGNLTFYDLINKYPIIPVSVSYEIDPCDNKKAIELYSISHEKTYKKKRYEDLDSMIRGFKGHKGRVHISIIPQIHLNKNDDEAEVSKKIDLAIHKNYYLWPTHYAAWDMYNKSDRFSTHYNEKAVKLLKLRMEKLEPTVKPFLLLQYANPVQNKIDEDIL